MKVESTLVALLSAALLGIQAGWSIAGQDEGKDEIRYDDKPRQFGVRDYNSPKEFAEKRKMYLEEYQARVPAEIYARVHPTPIIMHQGPTLKSTLDAAFAEIGSFHDGLLAFRAEVDELSAKAKKGGADAPNRFLVGQGQKIVKAMAHVYNDCLVPAANVLYEASEKGDQDLEILIMIAGKLAPITQLPRDVSVSGTELQLQLLQQVKAEYNQEVALRMKAGPMLDRALAEAGEIGPMIEEYDKAYAEYHHGTAGWSRLVSGAAENANSSLEKIIGGVVQGRRADQTLAQAQASENTAIAAVEACTKGTLAALKDPGNGGKQASASTLNAIAQAEVQNANVMKAQANSELGGQSYDGPTVTVGSDKESAKRVRFEKSGTANDGALRGVANGGASTLGKDIEKQGGQ